MNHWMSYPILIPILAALFMVVLAGGKLALQRGLSIVGSLGVLALGAWMMTLTADGSMYTYDMGNWPAPFGITLVLDALAALLVTLTGTVSLFAVLFACRGTDERGPYLHVMLQFQVAGIAGAFLTGDLFNLFVFFEILLLASYNLLVYSSGERRLRAGVHYVVLNLLGSSLFLIAVGTLYGVTGTLNMAHMAERVAALGPDDAALVQAAALLLMVVFALKAALLPLHLWLPNVYSVATAPAAAIFSLLTKVGVYTILRTSTLIFGEGAGVAANLLEPYLLPVALLTLAVGMIGAWGATTFRKVLGNLLIASLGTMLAAMGLFTHASISAGVYYLVHSTLVMAMFFLLIDLVARQRGPAGDDLETIGWDPIQYGRLGVLFFAGVIASAGLPPLSGFLGKLLMLQSAIEHPHAVAFWTVVLVTSLISIVLLSRAGTLMFWKTEDRPADEAAPQPAPAGELLPIVGLLACLVAYTVFAGPMTRFTDLIATQLLEPSLYISNVLRPH